MKFKSLLCLISAILMIGSLIGQNIKYPSKDYQNWKKSKAELVYEGEKASVMIQNSYVNAYIGSDGRFTIGTANGKRLLYGYPSYGSTSNTNIKIGATVYSNRSISGTVSLNNFISTSTYLSGASAITEWTIEGIRIKQILTPVTNPNQTGAIKVEFQVLNQTSNGKSVGILVQFDTMIDWNDYAPLKTSYGTVNVETGFYYPNLPTFWQAFEDPNYNPNLLIGEGTVIGGTAVPPSIMVAGSWPYLQSVAWSVTPSGSGYGDSSVLYRWDEEVINPGETIYYATFYGTGTASQTQDPLTIVYPNQTIELTIENGQLSPNPFEVNLIAINNTGGFVSNLSATIYLPNGLSLNAGSNQTQFFNPKNLQNGQDGDASFLINADFPDVDVTLPFTIEINCDQLPAQTIELSVFVPALQEFEINDIDLVIDNGAKLNSHKTKPYYDESDGENIVFRRSLPIDFQILYDGYFPNDFSNVDIELRRYKEDNNQITGDFYNKVSLEHLTKRGEISNTTINFSINLPRDAWIGKYKLRCKKTTDANWKETDFFYIIFNPFHGSVLQNGTYYYDQDVYSTNVSLTPSEVDTYVNSNEIRYYSSNYGENWNALSILSGHYSQIAFNTLIKRYEGYNNVVDIAKKISVETRKNYPNPNHDAIGILFGRWVPPYTCDALPGIPENCGVHLPWNWPDIKMIFQYYQQNGGAYFGQCFTFASLATSQLRAIGVPSRPITNAGDGVDGYPHPEYDYKVKQDDSDGTYEDSRWNFHVWTELWIPHYHNGSYFGWTAIDPTKEYQHRESSDYCGPAPVVRIKDNISNPQDQFVDEDYFFSHVSLPYYRKILGVWIKFKNNCTAGLRTFNPIFENGIEDRTSAYLSDSKEEVKTDSLVALSFSKKNYIIGDTIKGQISISSNTKQTQSIYFKLNVFPEEGFSVGANLDAINQLLTLDTLVSFSNDTVITFEVPYDVYQNFGNYQVDLAAVNISNDTKYLLSDVCTVHAIEINLNYNEEVLNQQIFDVEMILQNQSDQNFEGFELRIISTEEIILQNSEKSIFIPELNAGESINLDFDFLPDGNGKFPIIFELNSLDHGHISRKIEVLIKGAPKLNFYFDPNNKGKVGEIFYTEFYITNDGYLPAENVNIEFNIPDLFGESGQIEWNTLTINPFDTLTYAFELNPIQYGFGNILAEVYFEQTNDLISKNIGISSFSSNLVISFDTLTVGSQAPSYIDINITNVGLFNDKLKFLSLVTDTLVKCNFFHLGYPLPFNQLVINSNEEKTITLEIIPNEVTDESIAVSVTSAFDLDFKQTFFINILPETEDEQIIPLIQNWNLISSYREPESPQLENIFSDQITNSSMVIMLGKSGIFWPGQNINTIGNWNSYEGYKVKMNVDDQVIITGEEVVDKTVNLSAGTTFLPVLSPEPVPATTIFDQIEDELLFAFDLGGLIYWPDGGIYDLQVLELGRAYLLSMLADASVTFPESGGGKQLNGNKIRIVENSPWEVINTGNPHIISIFNAALTDLKQGDIIAAFNAEGACVGVTQYTGEAGNLPLVVYGNDLTTELVDGLVEGEAITVKVYDPLTQEASEVYPVWDSKMPNSGQFVENGLSAITSLKAATSLEDHSLSNLAVYPNPNTGLFTVTGIYDPVEIHVLNTSGQMIESFNANQSIEINLSNLAKGIYYLKVISELDIRIEKIIIK
jgi:hypothetical protein